MNVHIFILLVSVFSLFGGIGATLAQAHDEGVPHDEPELNTNLPLESYPPETIVDQRPVTTDPPVVVEHEEGSPFRPLGERVEKRREEIAENVAERREALTERIQERVTNLAANISNRLDAAVERLENISDRLTARIEKLNTNGINTTEAEEALANAEAAIALAKDLLSDIDELVADAIGSSDPQHAWQTVRETFVEIRGHITEAFGYLRDTVAALKEAVREAGDTGGVSDAVRNDNPPSLPPEEIQ
jgi:hypothetical protein